MRKLTKRTTAIVAASIIGVGAIGATAWAAGWFKSSASATVTTKTANPVTATITFDAPIYPTGTVGAHATATNNNPYAVKITGVTLADFTGNSGCTAANSGIYFTAPNVTLQPNHTGPVELGNVVHMHEWSDGACEGLGGNGVSATATLSGQVVAANQG